MNMLILATIIWIGVAICGIHYLVTERKEDIEELIDEIKEME